MKPVTYLDWHGLYKESWSKQIVPDAFSHPAKYSRALIREIYAFLIREGLLHQGDTVRDPFAGVALGGLDAMLAGCHWFGVELEQKFVDLGEANIALWNKRYNKMPRWGTARIIQGDSRQLSKVIDEANLLVSSPPYSQTGISDHVGQTNALKGGKFRGGGERFLNANYSDNPANLGNLRADERKLDAIVSSPPFSPTGNQPTGQGQGVRLDYRAGKRKAQSPETNYGASDGQLGAMPSGNVDSVISSPPYEASANEKQHTDSGIVGRDKKHGKGIIHNFRYTDGIVTSPPYEAMLDGKGEGTGATSKRNKNKKSSSMRGYTDSIVSSPPYEASLSNPAQDGAKRAERIVKWKTKHPHWKWARKNEGTSGRVARYGDMGSAYNESNKDNLGNSRGEDFWSAAQIILQECFKILKPGGTAVFVCKDFVRNKQRVPFSQQWARLCKSVGFVQTHWIKAWVVEDYGTQTAMDGQHKKQRKERKSFFRRLAEKKGSPHIDNEDVLIFRKPESVV